MTLLLLRSWDDNGQEGHCLVMKSISTLKGLWFLSYFVVKYIGRVTHDTVFWPFWYENTVTGVVRSRILCINYFGLHVSLLTFMSWNFTCLVWNWATIFGPVSKRPCQQAYFVTPQYPYTTLIFLEVLVLGDTFQGGYGYVLEPHILRIKISDR